MLAGISDVYFARPYASYERGTKENQHKLVRRFIPKGERLADISANTINQIQNWMNYIPRKILGYRTAKKAFLDELKAFVEQQKSGTYNYRIIHIIWVTNLNLKFRSFCLLKMR